MEIQHVSFILDGTNKWQFKVTWNDSISKDRLKRPVSPFLEVVYEKFFDSHLKNYIGKLKMITWNRFDTDCKNEWAIFTRLISLTGPLAVLILSIDSFIITGDIPQWLTNLVTPRKP